MYICVFIIIMYKKKYCFVFVNWVNNVFIGWGKLNHIHTHAYYCKNI